MPKLSRFFRRDELERFEYLTRVLARTPAVVARSIGRMNCLDYARLNVIVDRTRICQAERDGYNRREIEEEFRSARRAA
jgi:hypothetical protein